MVTLPVYTGSATAWQLVDFLNVQLRSDPAAGGRASIDAGQLDPDEMWLVDHMVVWCDSAPATTVRLYESMADPLRLLDGSRTGNFDVADWPSGLQVRPSTSLLAVWEGAGQGSRGVLTLQGRRMVRG